MNDDAIEVTLGIKHPKYFILTEKLMSEIYRNGLVGKINECGFRDIAMPIIQRTLEQFSGKYK